MLYLQTRVLTLNFTFIPGFYCNEISIVYVKLLNYFMNTFVKPPLPLFVLLGRN